MRQTSQGLGAHEMGAPDGVVIVEESGVIHKGQASVGVARQSCGTWGQVDNGQGGGAASAARQGAALVATRRFRPARWFSAAYAARRRTCKGPEAVAFHTPPQGAADRVKALRHDGRRPCREVVAAGLSGKSPDCLDAIDACGGGTTLGAVPADTRGGLQRPPPTEHPSPDPGEVQAKRVGASPTPTPVTVTAWERRTVSEGTPGPRA